MLPPGLQDCGTGEEIDRELLQDIKAYLEYRSLHCTPDRRLIVAWESFFRSCDPLIRRFARTCRVPATALDDCVQQVWTELILKLPAFRCESEHVRFRSWLYCLVHSRAIDLSRCRTRHPTESLSSETTATLYGRDEDPATEYERQYQQGAVQQVLAELRRQVSPLNYRVLHLRWLEGRTVEETAASLGLTPAQVRFRTHRLKQKFRRLFERYTDEERPPSE